MQHAEAAEEPESPGYFWSCHALAKYEWNFGTSENEDRICLRNEAGNSHLLPGIVPSFFLAAFVLNLS